VRLALTSDNILALLTIEKPSAHEVLVAKGLCILLRVNCTETTGSSDQDYWQQLKTIVRDKDDFYHKLHHFFFNNEAVSLAANAKVEGCLIICSECVKPRSENVAGDASSTSILLNLVQEWLHVIFESASGHEEENRLIREESADRSLLERTKTDHEVMTSSGCILRREIEHLNASIEFDSTTTAQLQRKVHLSKVMKNVTASGHTILSWAASSGNERIVKQVMKVGAHSAIGEDTIILCAIIIQIWFRRHQMKRSFDKLPLDRKSRELHLEHKAQCLTMTMRISSLHRIVTRRFGRIRLAILEALFNGHSELVQIVREMKRSDDNISLFQSVNLASMFCVPHISIPGLPRVERSPLHDSNLVSLLVPCIQYQHENDPKSCAYIASLRCAIDLAEEHLMRQRNALNNKIAVRKATLLRKYRQVKTLELKSAMRQEDFVGMVRIANQAGISLDFEDEDTGMTPLILAATVGEKGAYQELRLNNELVSPVSFLLDRVSPYKPTIGIENRLGVTALSAACSHSQLQAVEELLARGADINQKSVLTKQTPLVTACLLGRIDVVKLLISRGADCNDLSLMHNMALENRHYDVCDYLRQLNK
jgi:ankyrin repeat protein